MTENQTMPQTELDKCADCKKPFSPGQEYWAINYEEKAVMNSCLLCWDKYSTEKKQWEE